jgi:hypothetical protein
VRLAAILTGAVIHDGPGLPESIKGLLFRRGRSVRDGTGYGCRSRASSPSATALFSSCPTALVELSSRSTCKALRSKRHPSRSRQGQA